MGDAKPTVRDMVAPHLRMARQHLSAAVAGTGEVADDHRSSAVLALAAAVEALAARVADLEARPPAPQG